MRLTTIDPGGRHARGPKVLYRRPVGRADRVEDARTLLKEGDELEAKFIGVDKKSKTISLSIKAKDQDEETHTIKDHAQQAVGTPTMADLFKQLEK